MKSHLEALTQAATKTNEWKNAPFPFTKEEFIAAIKKADAVGQSFAVNKLIVSGISVFYCFI